jgi:hypothetical protein
MIYAAISLACAFGALGGNSTVDVCRDQPERVKALFAALNLDAPGMESIKQDVALGDFPRACDELLTHYRNGDSPAWLRRAAPAPSDKRLPEADDILNDKFTEYTIQMQVPRLPDGRLDWSCNGPDNDKEWGWGLNRHQWASTLLDAYFSTGNPIYAERLDNLLHDWVISNPYPGVLSSTPQWRGLEAYFRGGIEWPAVFYGLQQTDILTPATRILILSSIPEHAHYARNFHKPTGNWITMEMLGLEAEGIYWPEFKDAPEWRSYALSALVPELSAQVYPDGAQKELTEHYHRVATHCFQDMADLVAKANVQAPPEYKKVIEAMRNYVAYTMAPNGYAPLNNDSDYDYVRDEIHANSSAFERPDWLYIASNGAEGTAPAGLPSIVFPWAGQLVMREGWGADAQWGFFDAGPMGIAHWHHDKLHLSISASGRDILVDSGRYSYKSGPWRQFFTFSKSHNVVIVDGAGQALSDKEASAPIAADSYKITPEFDFARGEFSSGYIGVDGIAKHARAVFYKRGGYFVIADKITTDRPRAIQPLWHFHPSCAVEIEGADVMSTDPDQGNVRIVPLAPFSWRVEIVKGRDEPDIQGWWSPKYNVKEPNACATYSADIQSTAVFAWVIVPGKGRVPPIQAKLVSADENSVTVSARQEGGKTETITTPFTSGEPTLRVE